MLARRLADLGVEARVHSAGLLDDGLVAPPDAVASLAALGLDTSRHRSRRMNAAMLSKSDLVVGMARQHVQEAVILVPPAWPKTFTLKELVRRAESAGARHPGQPFDEWVAKVHAGRTRTELMGGGSSHDDVADPIGMSRSVYDRTAVEIDRLVSRLVELGWGAA